MGHGFVRTVDGQGVLDQVVGAYGQEVKVLKEILHVQSCRRNFDHRAQLDRAIGHALAVQRGARLRDMGQGLADFTGVGQHGHHQMHLAKRRGPQYGAQLGEEHGGVGQAPTNGAQAQCGVQVGGVAVCAVQGLVRADVYGADGDGQALHTLHRTLVGLKLLFFVGQMVVAPHEQKFAAEKAHTQRTCGDCAQCVFRHFDVGQQLYRFTVQGDGGRVQQPGQAAALQRHLPLLKAILRQNNGRWVDDHHAGVAVDDDPVVLAHQHAGRARTHHSGDVHAAGHDGGVRGFAAYVGDESGKHALLELQHVGRRQVVGHQHQGYIDRVIEQQVLLQGFAFAAGVVQGHGRGRALHGAQHALHYLLHIGFAFTQVFVFHLIEMANNDFQLRGERPLGVV